MNYYISVLKKYATFIGRARRSEFWYFTLFNFIISIAIGIFGGLLSVVVDPSLASLGFLYALVVFIPSIAVSVRRLHDTGRSGWWILISLVPIVGGIIFLIFAFGDSQQGQNQYGPSPKDERESVVEAVVLEGSTEIDKPNPTV